MDRRQRASGLYTPRNLRRSIERLLPRSQVTLLCYAIDPPATDHPFLALPSTMPGAPQNSVSSPRIPAASMSTCQEMPIILRIWKIAVSGIGLSTSRCYLWTTRTRTRLAGTGTCTRGTGHPSASAGTGRSLRSRKFATRRLAYVLTMCAPNINCPLGSTD